MAFSASVEIADQLSRCGGDENSPGKVPG